MNPRAIDLQLLLVFDAVMTERHVTNAAKSMGLSQSAMSHALGRLRERVGDPLLVRTGRGMVPTARALELIGPVRDAIRHVQDVFISRPDFQPAESHDSFVVRIGDANEFLLLPTILAELESRAPGVSLVVRHLSPSDTVKGLEDGSVDFAISAFLSHPKSIRSASLMKDRMVCATRRDHPSTRRRLTIDTFLRLRHIRVVQHAGDVRFVDEHLLARGLKRNVVATIPHWLVALHMVASTRLATAIPERMAKRFDTEGRLALRALPLGGEKFDWQIYWHQRHEAVPGQIWMRGLISNICSRIDESSSLRGKNPTDAVPAGA